ncbi:MAG: endonuclease/exonuclease/phosphatase family protein [Thermoplasmatota archaeon]
MSLLRVMSFNLRRAGHEDGKNAWSQRLPLAREVLSRWDPDIVGTQEGLAPQLDTLSTAFCYDRVGRPRAENDEHCAILYRPARLELLDSGDFWLSATPEVEASRTWGNYLPRMLTWARFRDRRDGQVFQFWNTHLDHFAPAARRRGAHLIRERFPHDEPLLLVGDFNSLPRGTVYNHMTKANGTPGLVDSWKEAEEAEPARWPATFHNFTGRGLYRIDYIFAHPDFRVERAETVRFGGPDRWPSDHFPVYAEVCT